MVKTFEWWVSRGYLFNPTVSFLIGTHNMSQQVVRMIRVLRGWGAAEIIVMDDGSDHRHVQQLLDELTGVNEFLLHANDLFEVVTMNRAIGFARGEFAVLLQDDDVLDSLDWVSEALQLFVEHPDMAILGGRQGITIDEKGGWVAEPGAAFSFAQTVNLAPMWLRLRRDECVSPFSNDFAPCMWAEAEMCFRVWLAGCSVGLYSSPGLRNSAVLTGVRREEKAPITRRGPAHLEKLVALYGDEIKHIDRLVVKEQEGM